MDEKIEQLAKDLKLIKELQASDIYTANYQEAKALFSLGYRKESDTAREIIEWIKRNGTLGYGGYVIHDSTIEQICKKYGVHLGE